jgi:TPR repeat protein
MHRIARLFALILALCATAAAAADRMALVIGNGNYRHVPALKNTINDARAIADTLDRIGFEVTTLIDADQVTLAQALNDFAFRAETADLALIYYAGHGVEVQGQNMLIPVDANITSNRDIQRQSVSLKDLLAAVDRARKMRIVILDSCREVPFDDSLLFDTATGEAVGTGLVTRGTGGLAAPSPDRGTLVAYAARDGQVALDGAGDHSPFALALMEKLESPGLEISLMFRQVRDQVLAETGNLQEPNTYGSLPGIPFYLAGAPEVREEIAADDPRQSWSKLRPDQELQLSALAATGDTRSMLGLAYMRLNPESPRYNPKEAAELLERAAATGEPEAQFELAKLLETGIGAPPDPARALALYEQAAAQGFADAINDLGFLHYYGSLGLPKDQARALDLFRQAADLRHPEAMFNFAALIDDGLVPGSGPADSAAYLYGALRAGSEDVFSILSERPTMFSHATRRALQAELKRNAFYDGDPDGAFGPGTRAAIRAAFGLAPTEEQN